MIETRYLRPLVFSLFFHALIIALLFVHMPHKAKTFTVKPSQKPVKIVQAVTVDQQAVDKLVTHLKREKALKQKRLHDLEVKAKAAIVRRVKEQHRLAALKKQQALAKKKLIAHQKLLAKQKAAAAKQEALKKKQALEKVKKQAKLAQEKARRVAKAKALAAAKAKTIAQLKKKKEAILAKQLAEEQRQISLAQARRNGELDKYKALILQSIARHWLLPSDVDQHKACILLVHLAPSGQVIDVSLAKSSGDTVLDRTARTAVLKSSPLPVPKFAVLFAEFRELHLTMRPEELM